MKIGKLRYCIGGLVGLPMVLAAQNPIVQTMYTADPAPMVYEMCIRDRSNIRILVTK